MTSFAASATRLPLRPKLGLELAALLRRLLLGGDERHRTGETLGELLDTPGKILLLGLHLLGVAEPELRGGSLQALLTDDEVIDSETDDSDLIGTGGEDRPV